MRDIKMLEIAGHKIAYGSIPIISAELGVNHQNDLDLALQMIDEVAETGAQAVKIQFLRADDFCSPGSKTIKYRQFDNLSSIAHSRFLLKEVYENYYEFFKRHEISLDFVKACYKRAKEHDLIFGITTTSAKGVREVSSYTDYFKIASDMITKDAMMQQMIDLCIKPIVISTGHIQNFIHLNELKKHFPASLWLHCVSEYPCKNPKLWKIKHMQELGYTVGYSDHSLGNESAIRAEELGALWIECHYTSDKTLAGPDHHFSKDKEELKALVKAIK